MNDVNLAPLRAPSPAGPFGVVPAMRSHPRENMRCVEASMLGYEDPRVAAFGACRPKQFAARRGLRYEKQVLNALALRLPSILSGPWLSYRLAGEPAAAVCQPDGLWYGGPLEDRALVVEVKTAHTSDAWHQLQRYRAIAQVLYGPAMIQVLNVVRSFDPRVPFPEAQELFDDMDAAIADRSTGYRVLVWKR